MKEISVDIDVYSAIWAQRRSPEQNENEILRRILVSKEVKISDLPASQTSRQNTHPANYPVFSAKVRWIDDVVSAFRQAGGEADLSEAYKIVGRIRADRGEIQKKTHDAIIRRSIEEHSSDSENFTRNNSSQDLFAKVGRGRWRLRNP